MTKYQKNLLTVLPRIIKLVEEDEDFAEWFAHDLESVLDDYAAEDGFGTEQQLDPRGDARKNYWTLLDEDGVEK